MSTYDTTQIPTSGAGGDALEWRVDPIIRGLAGVMIGMFGLIVLATGVLSVAKPISGGLGVWLAMTTISLLAAAGLRRVAFRPLVRVEADHLLIRNVTDEHRLAWHQILSITPGYFGTTFDLGGGRSVCATALQKSNYAQALGKATRADEIAQVVAARAAHGQGFGPAGHHAGPGASPAALLLPDADARRRSQRTARIVIGCAVAWLVLSSASKILA